MSGRHHETRCIDPVEEAYKRFLVVTAELAAVDNTTAQTQTPTIMTVARGNDSLGPAVTVRPAVTTLAPSDLELCGPGEYYHTGKGRCWDCPGGSFAPLAGVRTGGDDYVCPGRCATGYMSRARSTSADDCELGVKVMWHSSTHKWCTGSNDTTSQGKLWDNQGYRCVSQKQIQYALKKVAAPPA